MVKGTDTKTDNPSSFWSPTSVTSTWKLNVRLKSPIQTSFLVAMEAPRTSATSNPFDSSAFAVGATTNAAPIATAVAKESLLNKGTPQIDVGPLDRHQPGRP